MTELGQDLARPPRRAGHHLFSPSSRLMRARHLLDPPGDARPAPHSAPPGLRRADPLRPTHASAQASCHPLLRKRGRVRVGVRCVTATPPSSTPRSSPREKACPERDPGAGARWRLASDKIPHPEGALKAAVSKSLPPRRPGDAPAPLPHPLAGPQAKARGLDPRGGTHRPNTAATAPALRFRGSAEQRTGATIHPET
jgi:hypothetical protein